MIQLRLARVRTYKIVKPAVRHLQAIWRRSVSADAIILSIVENIIGRSGARGVVSVANGRSENRVTCNRVPTSPRFTRNSTSP